MEMRSEKGKALQLYNILLMLVKKKKRFETDMTTC